MRHAATRVIHEEYPLVGFNYRMTDIQAAIGREQLKRLPDIVARRRELAARYHAALRGRRDIAVPMEPEWARSNWQSYAIRVPAERQSDIMQTLLERGISTRRGVMNAHLEAAYPAGTWRAAAPLVHSEEAQKTAIILPLFHQLTFEDQDRVIAALLRVVSGG